MNTTTTCPPTEELQQLIRDSLTGERQQICVEHLDSCTCCQERIEQLATEGTNLSQMVQREPELEPVETSAYWPALQNASSVAGPVAVKAPVARSRELKLGFLEPATDPAYLGRLAHFDVMRVLGRGGMGVVLEAFDSKLQRNVALKVLDPELASDEIAKQRFCREARAAAAITHENVVTVHQVERLPEAGLAFLVMQLISGESLEQRLTREKQLPHREVVRIGLQAAQGLAAAHAHGLIHRDIKPGNLLLEPPHGRVKLTDFGLARVAEDVKLTRTGFVTGTPLYMAPEQAMGEEADQRSDLFSLGAVLYEMSAGQPPFAGNSALAILKQIADAKHRSLSELSPATPDWLVYTIDRLLAKKPSDRIQTAAELVELFEFEWAMLKTSSDELPQVCAIEERKRTVRNRWIVALASVAFLLVGLVAGSFVFNRGAAAPVAETSSAQPDAVLSANSGTVWSVAFDPTSRTVAMAVEDGSVRLWDLSTKSVKSSLTAHRGIVWSTKFAPTGEFLATSGDDGLVKLWKLGENEPFKTFEHSNAVRGMALSPDGQKLFAGDRKGELKVWSIENGEPLASVEQPSAIYSVAIASTGTTLATAGNDGIIRLWNTEPLQVKMPLSGHSGPVHSVSFNHDGSRLASAGWDKTVRIWDAGTGLLVKSWVAHTSDIWNMTYSPDGTKIATTGGEGAVKIWNAESGELLATYFGHNSPVHTVAFNAEEHCLFLADATEPPEFGR